MSRYSSHIRLGLNAASFALIIGAQQLLVMPTLARALDPGAFSQAILGLIGINILSAAGEEAGNVKTILERGTVGRGLQAVYLKMLLVAVGVVFLVATGVYAGLASQWLLGLLFATASSGAVVRMFMAVHFRHERMYPLIIAGGALYLLGAGLGLGLRLYEASPLWPLVVAEISVGFLYLPLLLREVAKNRSERSVADRRRVARPYGQLLLSSAILNVASYADRVLALPLLGTGQMAIYYAATSMARMVSLVMNPLSSFLLAENSKVGGASTRAVRVALERSVWLLFGAFGLCVVLSIVGLRIFYPMYFEASRPLIVPISIAVAFTVSAYYLKAFVLLFGSKKEFALWNLSFVALLLVSIVAAASLWGLVGFAWAGALARFAQCGAYYHILGRVSGTRAVENP